MGINVNYECCKHCSNNPDVNPHASGVCCCSLPYMSTTARPGHSETITFGTATSSNPPQTCSYMTTSDYKYTYTTTTNEIKG